MWPKVNPQTPPLQETYDLPSADIDNNDSLLVTRWKYLIGNETVSPHTSAPNLTGA